MAIEAMSEEMNKDLNKRIIEKENTNTCHINLDNKQVVVDVPIKDGETKRLVFPAMEFKRLFEKIYLMSK